MTTRAEKFAVVCERNALRREARLPLLDVATAMADLEYDEAMAGYNAAFKTYRAVYDEMRTQARRALQVRKANLAAGRGVVGNMAVTAVALPAYRTFLAGKGWPYPGVKTPVIYGGDKVGATNGEVDTDEPILTDAVIKQIEVDLKLVEAL